MNEKNKTLNLILTVLFSSVRLAWRVFKFLAKTIIVIFILITILMVGLAQINTKYKFTFPEESHPIIDKLNNYANNNLSLATLYGGYRKQKIDAEFLVLTSDYDIDLLPVVTGKDFLFSAIEFYKPTKAKIEISHYYNGKELPVVAEYIYHYPRKDDGKIDRSKKFIVSKTKGPNFDEKERFVYVRIYKAPNFNHYLPKFLWFNNTMKQSINIEFEDEGTMQTLDYKLDLKWKKTWSAWETIMNTT